MDERQATPELLARPQHYYFAHQYLRDLFFGSPPRFFDLMAGKGRTLLVGMWKILEEDFTSKGFAPIPPDGLDVEILDLEDRASLILIKLPEPRMMLEAYFVAAVYRRDQSSLARFFTSEYNHSTPGNRPVAFLCEWDASGNHGNMGVLEDNTVPGFVEAVRKSCRDQSP